MPLVGQYSQYSSAPPVQTRSVWGAGAQGAGSGAASGASFGPWGAVIGAGIGAGASMYAAKKQNQAAREGARVTSSAATHAADLEANAALQALAYQQQVEATRRQEFETTQDRNYALWQRRESQLQPYRDLGRGALGQLMRPIPRADPNSLGALLRRAG